MTNRRRAPTARPPRKGSWLSRPPAPAAPPVVQLVPTPTGWAVQGTPPATPHGSHAAAGAEVVRFRNSDPLSQALGRAQRAAWRHRWQLAPLVATAAVVAVATAGAGAAAVLLGIVAVLGHLATTRGPETIRGRAWLSERERSTVTLWAGDAALWSGAAAAGAWSTTSLPGLAALAALTGVPVVAWWRSRRIRRAERPKPLSARAQELLATWPATIATTGPAPLRGSVIVPGSVTEPAGDTITCTVRLTGVHAETAANDEVRRHLEVALKLGVGTVQLEVDRDNAAQVRITLTPSRHLELVEAPWPGPVLHENGDIDFALTPAGDDVRIGLHNNAGVEHFAVVGTTGGGKSNSVATAVLPGTLARREVLWYADGGLGSSAAHLAGAADWWAVEGPARWAEMINAAAMVCEARRARRAARGLSSWRGAKETDPIVTVLLDEAALMVARLDARTAGQVLEIERVGRKLGVRIGQVVQDPVGPSWVGGREARDLMAGGGTLIGHRAASSTAAVLSAGSTADGIDLRALPPQAGWVAVIRQGQILAPRARVRYADPAKVLELLDGFTPRELAGEDLMAAGAAYRDRVRGVAAAAKMREADTEDQPQAEVDPNPAQNRSHSTIQPAEVPTAAAAAAQQGREQVDQALTASQRAAQLTARLNQRTIAETLARFPEGLTQAQVAQETGLAKTTVRNALERLQADGQARRDEAGSWHATTAEAVA